jgi:hypothetical protein
LAIPKLVKLHKKYDNRVAFVTVGLEKNDRYWNTVLENVGYSWVPNYKKDQACDDVRVGKKIGCNRHTSQVYYYSRGELFL